MWKILVLPVSDRVFSDFCMWSIYFDELFSFRQLICTNNPIGIRQRRVCQDKLQTVNAYHLHIIQNLLLKPLRKHSLKKNEKAAKRSSFYILSFNVVTLKKWFKIKEAIVEDSVTITIRLLHIQNQIATHHGYALFICSC